MQLACTMVLAVVYPDTRTPQLAMVYLDTPAVQPVVRYIRIILVV